MTLLQLHLQLVLRFLQSLVLVHQSTHILLQSWNQDLMLFQLISLAINDVHHVVTAILKFGR